jgi:hypothetical protein
MKMKNKNGYDEKQVMDRGFAFQCAFYTSMLMLLFVYMLVSVFGIRINAHVGFIICWWIPVFVCFIIMIVRDAFDCVHTGTGKKVLTIIGFAGLILLVTTAIDVIGGKEPMFENGGITSSFSYLLSGASMVIICAAYWTRQYANRKKYRDE